MVFFCKTVSLSAQGGQHSVVSDSSVLFFTLILQCMAHGHIYSLLLKPFCVTESQRFSGDLSMMLLALSFIYSLFLWCGG